MKPHSVEGAASAGSASSRPRVRTAGTGSETDAAARSGPPPKRVSSVGSAGSDSAQLAGLEYHELAFDRCMFIDEASIKEGWRSRAEDIVRTERSLILEILGEANTRKFNTVGFCEKRPVQIISPFLVPPGSLRREWMNEFFELHGRETLDRMPLLVYWFDQSLSSGKPHITLEKYDTFVSYDEGQLAGYGDMPKSIQQKYIFGKELTTEDKRAMATLGLLEKAKDSGTPPFTKKIPDHELFDVVPCPPINKEDASPKMAKQNDRVAVWWDDYQTFFNGTVVEVRGSFHRIIYDDAETEWTPLAERVFKILPKDKVTTSSTENTCLACDLGSSYHKAHDTTCPKSRFYVDHKQHTTKDSAGNARAKKKGTKKRNNSVVKKTIQEKCNKRARTNSKERKRKAWTEQEDNTIMSVVKNSTEIPFRSWAMLAELLPGRDRGHVKYRWKNYLNPILDHSPFSREDNLALWEGRKKLGNQWTEISTQFFGSRRSGDQLYNFWSGTGFKNFIGIEFGPDAYDAVDSLKVDAASNRSAFAPKKSSSRIQTNGNLHMTPPATKQVANESSSGSKKISGGTKNKGTYVSSGFSSIIDEWEAAVSRRDATASFEKLQQLYDLFDPDSSDFLDIDAAVTEGRNLKELFSATRHLLKDNFILSSELDHLESLLNQDLEEEEEEEEADI